MILFLYILAAIITMIESPQLVAEHYKNFFSLKHLIATSLFIFVFGMVMCTSDIKEVFESWYK